MNTTRPRSAPGGARDQATRPASQLVLIDGGRTAPRPQWQLDERTRRIGRLGVAQARAILREVQPPEPPGRQRERRAS
jgi:hypothetical protein